MERQNIQKDVDTRANLAVVKSITNLCEERLIKVGASTHANLVHAVCRGEIEKNIERLYKAGLFLNGDLIFLENLHQYAKQNNLEWLQRGNRRYNDTVPSKFNGNYGPKLYSLYLFPRKVPDVVVDFLVTVNEKMQKHLFIAEKEVDPILFLQIPLKHNCADTYYIEVMRWQ